MKRFWRYFTMGEKILWLFSVAMISVSYGIFGEKNAMVLAASLLGVTSLIFNAKGNPVGQVLMVVFSLLYGIISYTQAYYGEMITYLGMTAPMAVIALVSWLRNPFNGNHAEVSVGSVEGIERAWMLLLTSAVTALFYFVLRAFDTKWLMLSTLSVTTSFLAVYLTFRRSAFYAVAYAFNDVVLIALWLLAAGEEKSYFSVVICFAMFLLNDLYGFFSWRRMHRRQTREQ